MDTKLPKTFYATAILAGSIIGAGIFALPFIGLKSGLGILFFYLVFLGIICLFIHNFVAEISLKSPDFKRIPSFVGEYLGKNAKRLSFVSAILGMLGVILAYIILGGNFISLLGPDPFWGTLIFFLLGAVFIFAGISMISRIELWAVVSFFVVILIVFLKTFNLIDVANFDLENNFAMFFLPYGPVLFSFWGISIIPEVEEVLGKEKKSLKKVIAFSMLICFLIYSLFIFLVLGLCGGATTESAIDCLSPFGDSVLLLVVIFGLLTTFTSFITIGLTLKKVFWFDLKIDKKIAALITCGVPLILFLIGITDFIEVISFVAGIFFAIDGILIILIYGKINRKKRWLAYSIGLVFLAGAALQIISFFN